MTIIEFIEHSSTRCISIKACLIEIFDDCPVRLTLIALQSKGVISPSIDDLRSDCRSARRWCMDRDG